MSWLRWTSVWPTAAHRWGPVNRLCIDTVSRGPELCQHWQQRNSSPTYIEPGVAYRTATECTIKYAFSTHYEGYMRKYQYTKKSAKRHWHTDMRLMNLRNTGLDATRIHLRDSTVFRISHRGGCIRWHFFCWSFCYFQFKYLDSDQSDWAMRQLTL